MKYKYPEEEAKPGHITGNLDTVSIDFQAAIKRNKQLKQVKLNASIILLCEPNPLNCIHFG